MISDSPAATTVHARRRMIASYPQSGASVLLLIAALFLGGRGVREALHVEPATPAPVTTALTDPRDRAARLKDAVGRFATGKASGDRVIEIQPDGTVRFYVLAKSGPAFVETATFELRQRDRVPCLVTAGGVIEMIDIDHLRYFDDTYERTARR